LLMLLWSFSFCLESEIYRKEFASFCSKYEKVYTPEEQSIRFQVFKDNLDFIYAHNNKSPKPSFTVNVNQFADLTVEEFSSIYLRTRATVKKTHTTSSIQVNGLPNNVDWRDKHAVTFVKDQGQCGSCYSFSTTGAVEGAWAIAKGKLKSLSEQNILDCTWKPPYNNTGCDGGDPRESMQYIIDNKGIDTEDSYPYEDYNGGDQDPCTYNPKNSVATISSMLFVIQGNETDLAVASTIGTVSVAIDASHSSFQFYQGGVYSEPMCSSNLADLDHAVLVVGYDTDGEYWNVKNSWGPGWGFEGYIWMSKDNDNNCGIATYATLPKV